MHPKLKALLEKFPGLTLEQIKAQHQTEYSSTMIAIAEEVAQAAPTPTPTPTPVTPPAPVAAPTNAETTLERTVLGLTSELQQERREKVVEKRTNIAITALEAANLPKAPKVGDLDLNNRFREQLVAAAVAAESEQEAQDLVGQMITERRALMGGAQKAEGRDNGARNGVDLPVGDNGRTQTEAERRAGQGGANRQMESIRGRAGLI